MNASKIVLLACLLLFVSIGSKAADLVVIANSSIGISSINRSQLANLFLISPASWPDGTAAAPIDLPLSNAISLEFYDQMLGRSIGQIRAFRARQIFSGTGYPPDLAATPSEVLRRVGTTPGAVGYIPKEFVDRSVIVLMIR